MLVLFFVSCSNPVKEVFSNYQQHKSEIFLATQYFSQIKLRNLNFYIRFNSDSTLDLRLSQKNVEIDYIPLNSAFANSALDSNGDIGIYGANINDDQVQKVLLFLRLDNQKLLKLEEMLCNANCISIANNSSSLWHIDESYTSVGYPGDGWYGLEYIVFHSALKRSRLKELDKSCSFKIISDSVVVEYGGPAFGSDCFPDKK